MRPVRSSDSAFSPAAQAARAAAQAACPARNCRVLIVEDHEDTRFMLRHIIERSGFDVLESGDAETALELARTEKPDLILMDLSLPGMDGISVIELLRVEEKGESVPIILMSGRMKSEMRPVNADVGYDDYLMKPLDLDHLISMIRWRLSPNATQELLS